ncbi:hypothetical protein VP01_2913g1, partial [Puccinia sorghi]
MLVAINQHTDTHGVGLHSQHMKGKELLDHQNFEFNYHLAQSQVRIEHAIGILKATLSSLASARGHHPPPGLPSGCSSLPPPPPLVLPQGRPTSTATLPACHHCHHCQGPPRTSPGTLPACRHHQGPPPSYLTPQRAPRGPSFTSNLPRTSPAPPLRCPDRPPPLHSNLVKGPQRLAPHSPPTSLPACRCPQRPPPTPYQLAATLICLQPSIPHLLPANT